MQHGAPMHLLLCLACLPAAQTWDQLTVSALARHAVVAYDASNDQDSSLSLCHKSTCIVHEPVVNDVHGQACVLSSVSCAIRSKAHLLQLCREHLGRHPCDKRRSLSHYKKQFPAVDFSLVSAHQL